MSGNVFQGLDLDQRPRLELAALIDMSFLLLIFFMVAATLQKQEADLPVHLPAGARTGTSASPVELERMIIDVDDHGTVRLNNEPLSPRPGLTEMQQLRDRLSRYAAVARVSGSNPRVEIQCADAAAEQRFIDVLSASHGAGIERIRLVDDDSP